MSSLKHRVLSRYFSRMGMAWLEEKSSNCTQARGKWWFMAVMNSSITSMYALPVKRGYMGNEKITKTPPGTLYGVVKGKREDYEVKQ